MASVVSRTLPIEAMAAGERGVVVEIDGTPELVVRLAEMGLHTGTRIRLIRPGAPCILEIEQQRFSFRFDDLVTVLVEIAE
ncbi:ferrous iron transport protein A [Schlesneria sp. T3-172]|uniref:FeoA family protein n=1 Tax=Schlesneria sphaerica TaxID=3373610 RepID=UPI0037C5DE31